MARAEPPATEHRLPASPANLPDAALKGFTAHAATVGTRVYPGPRAQLAPRVHAILRDAGARGVAIERAAAAAYPELPAYLARYRVQLLEAATLFDAAPATPAAGLSLAAFGVVETGSIALASADPEERAIGMLTETHLVLLRASELLANLDAAGARLRADTTGAQAKAAAYVTLVTGASRTSDIERVLTIGVHGPRALHVVVLTDE